MCFRKRQTEAGGVWPQAGMVDSHLGWPKQLLASMAQSDSEITHHPKASSENTFGERNYSNPMRKKP